MSESFYGLPNDPPEKRDPPRQRPWDTQVAVPLPNDGGFTPQEHWAWSKIIRGEPADMRFAKYDSDDGAGENTAESDKWPEHRVLSAKFFETVLFHEPWRSARAKPWLRVRCAIVCDEISWQNEQVTTEFGLVRCVFKGTVNWIGLRVDGTINLAGARFCARFDGDGMRIRGDLFCRDGFRTEKEFEFLGCHIEGDLSLAGAKLAQGMNIDGLRLGGGFFIRRGFTSDGPIKMLGSVVEGSVQIQGVETTINAEVNLTGSRIQSELAFDQGGKFCVDWGPKAELVLRNVSCQAFSAAPQALLRATTGGKKEHMPVDLLGFTYRQIGGTAGMGDRAGATLADASPRQLRAFLASDRGNSRTFTPQPYRQLARVLAEGGHQARADAVLKALANHELGCKDVSLGRKVGLFFSKHLVMYGYGSWRALALFGLLVVSGVGYGLWVSGGFERSLEEIIAWARFTFGNAVPLLTLDETHKDFLHTAMENSAIGNPEAIKLAFDGQKMVGYVLLTYLAAGLSGLASKPKA